jgi:hypothetical protein
MLTPFNIPLNPSLSLPQTLQQPAMRLVQTLTANQSRLVGTLQQLHHDKSESA